MNQVALKRKSETNERLYLCLTGDKVSFVPSEHQAGHEVVAEGCSWTISTIGSTC